MRGCVFIAIVLLAQTFTANAFPGENFVPVAHLDQPGWISVAAFTPGEPVEVSGLFPAGRNSTVAAISIFVNGKMGATLRGHDRGGDSEAHVMFSMGDGAATWLNPRLPEWTTTTPGGMMLTLDGNKDPATVYHGEFVVMAYLVGTPEPWSLSVGGGENVEVLRIVSGVGTIDLDASNMEGPLNAGASIRKVATASADVDVQARFTIEHAFFGVVGYEPLLPEGKLSTEWTVFSGPHGDEDCPCAAHGDYGPGEYSVERTGSHVSPLAGDAPVVVGVDARLA